MVLFERILKTPVTVGSGIVVALMCFPSLIWAQQEPQLDTLLDPPSIQQPVAITPSNGGLNTELAAKVEILLEQLRSGTAEQQEQAEKSLLSLGPSILAHLPRLPSSVTGNFRNRLDYIRDSMQSKAIGEYAEPSKVTLQGKFPAGDVLLEIIDQTDNELTIEELPKQEMEVNFEQASFWEALDIVLDELRLEATTSATDVALRLVPTKTPGVRAARGSYAGVFRIEPTRVDAIRSIRADRLSYMNVEISLMWEPRLRPAYFSFPMRSVLVECDNGEILSAATPDSSPEYTTTDAHSIQANLMLALPSRDAKIIRRISGTLKAAIPGAIVQLEFDNLEQDKPINQKVGNLKVALEEMKKRDEIYEFRILVSLRDAGQTMDSFRGWFLTHEAYVLNAKDERVNNAGWQTYQMNSEAVGLTYFFDLGASIEGCRLIYSAPGAVTEQQVDYILKDIPLP